MDLKPPVKFSLDSGLGDRELGSFMSKHNKINPVSGSISQLARVNSVDLIESEMNRMSKKQNEYRMKELK